MDADVPSQFTMQLACSGSNASGFVHVRVRRLAPASACAPYTFTASAE